MDIIKAYAVNNLCFIQGKKMIPKGIVVHSTGANNPYLSRYVDCPEEVGENIYNNHWNTPTPGGKKVCVHAFIGYDVNEDVRVAEILPLDYCCWGVGAGRKGSYNYNPPYIQFEICEDGLIDKVYFDKVISKAVEYCVYLCKKYNISVENIVSHREAYFNGYGSNHSDPEHWMERFDYTMDDFRIAVSKNVHIVDEPSNDKSSYMVKVTVEALNIREGAGTIYPKCGVITDEGTYTILEEKDGAGASKWGKLKSGAGWIALDYTRKI